MLIWRKNGQMSRTSIKILDFLKIFLLCFHFRVVVLREAIFIHQFCGEEIYNSI